MSSSYPSEPIIYEGTYSANLRFGRESGNRGKGYMNTSIGQHSLSSVEYKAATVDNGKVAEFSDSAGGVNNVALGAYALVGCENGSENTMIGTNAGINIKNEKASTGVGYNVMSKGGGPDRSTAVGAYALEDIDGANNTAVGYLAGNIVRWGTDNTLIGRQAMQNIDGPTKCVAVGSITGVDAGQDNNLTLYNRADRCVFIGHKAGNIRDTNRTILNEGDVANVILIGADAEPYTAEGTDTILNNQVVLGNDDTEHTFIRGAVNAATINTEQLFVNGEEITASGGASDTFDTINASRVKGTNSDTSLILDPGNGNSLIVGSETATFNQHTVSGIYSLSSSMLESTSLTSTGSALSLSANNGEAVQIRTDDVKFGGKHIISCNDVGAVTGTFSGAVSAVTGTFSDAVSAASGSFSGAVSALSFTTTSDARLKKDVVPLASSLDVVKSMNPVTFTWTDSDKPDVGFIAQELASLEGDLPGVVDHSNEDKLSIAYNRIIPALTKSIQELAAKVEALEERLNSAVV
jgi:hypothetical protein